MDLAAIKKLLPPDSDLDVDACYEAFRRDQPRGLDRFLLHLYQEGHIEQATLTWMGDVEAVETRRLSPALPTTLLLDANGELPPEAEPVGTRFEEIETIGRGGMGSVTLARDPDLRRYVAYKRLHDEHASSGVAVGRFNFEAQVTAQLDHPNIVPVYSYDAGHGYAMKLVAGRTLEQVLAEARAQYDAGGPDEEHAPAALLEHFLKVCDAVNYAHIKGVVHRDLKPQNILVGRYNEVYVVDWGIAKLLSDDPVPGAEKTVRIVEGTALPQPETQDGDLLGTIGYMSPEQLNGEHEGVGVHSDVFVLGLILYEVVTLRRAYRKDAMRSMLEDMTLARLPPVTHARGRAVSRELAAIVARACARNPDARYPSAEALANDVRRHLRGEEVSVRPDNLVRRVARWVGHHREAAMLIVALAVIAGATVSMWAVLERQQAVIAAQAREERLAGLVTRVAGRAQLIERHFLDFEAMVEGLAAAASQLVLRGVPSTDPLYTSDDFAAPARAPPDYEHSAAYAKAVSLDWPVFKLAPGAESIDVVKLMRKVAPLRHYYKQTLFESVAGTGWHGDERGVRARILEQGAALTWAYVGLAAGIHLAYPGKTGYPIEYDPRARPWYRHSVDNQGTAWLPPYIDVNGRGLVVPCTRPLRRPDGTLIGVAGVEMTLDHIQQNLLDMSRSSEIVATYLVDHAGLVVASSGAGARSFRTGTLVHDLADLEPYPGEQVVEAIRSSQSGHVVQAEGDRERVTVYQRLGSVRWYLVAEALFDADS